jgi:Uri superfamily endonuclease
MPPRRPGAYILFITLETPIDCPIGKRHRQMTFPAGSYVYIGSARNGLDQRITRHIRTTKKTHWHIDYLLPHTHTIHAYYTTNTHQTECHLATTFHKHHTPIPNFGNSDCTCPTHLYYGTPTALLTTIQSLHLTKYPLSKS